MELITPSVVAADSQIGLTQRLTARLSDTSADHSAPLRDERGVGTAWAQKSGFTKLRVISRGQGALVYQATQMANGKHVALKLQYKHDDRGLSRNEAVLLASMNHPNIVRLVDAAGRNALPYIATEWLSGGSLESKLRNTRFQKAAAVRIARSVARALAHVHDRNVIHCDVKPGNILLTARGRAKLADFGISRWTLRSYRPADGALTGTPAFMAPEQANGDDDRLCPATDLYALGATLFELLTGESFRQGNLYAAIRAASAGVIRAEPRELNRGIDPKLNAICLKCVAKEPTDRYRDARHLAIELSQWLVEHISN